MRVAMLLAAGVAFAPPEGPAIARPPRDLGLSPFYAKYVDAEGLPVLSSSRVPDEALRTARAIVSKMTSKRPDVRKEMVRRGTRIAVMARTEVTTDVPEHADLQKAFPQTDWNRRARGLGATFARPVCSCAEENLLGYEKDPYRGESILIHEFAHTVAVMGIEPLEPEFRRELGACYEAATKKGLWKDTYAATNADEYWAEGVQDWFDANFESAPADGIHNQVNTRGELKNYDSRLAALVGRYFPDDAWRWKPPGRSRVR